MFVSFIFFLWFSQFSRHDEVLDEHIEFCQFIVSVQYTALRFNPHLCVVVSNCSFKFIRALLLACFRSFHPRLNISACNCYCCLCSRSCFLSLLFLFEFVVTIAFNHFICTAKKEMQISPAYKEEEKKKMKTYSTGQTIDCDTKFIELPFKTE